MVIYKTTNLINSKYYIGKDEKNNPDYLGSGLLLNRAIKKHGRENFKKEILETCTNRTELNEKEIYWIEKPKAIENGYNIALGGAGGDTYTNNPNLEIIIEKLSGKNNHFYGKKHKDESKVKIGDSKLGKQSWNSGKTGVYSEETKIKMSKARLAMTGESSSNFINIDKTELIDILLIKSQKDTAKYFDVSLSCIQRKLKDFKIDYDEIKKQRVQKVIVSAHYYEISDELFDEILRKRETNKQSFKELSIEFKIGINKLRQEFIKRNVSIIKIK